MSKNFFNKRVFSSLILPFFLIACTTSNQAESNQSSPATTVTAPAKGLSLNSLPDFSDLVAQEGPAVVNISTIQTIHDQAPQFQIPGMSPDDPFYDFFRHFMQPYGGAPRDYQAQSLGSGFIISPDGYILTNAHVVANADEVTVKLTDKRTFKAKVIGSDPRGDVALIKIDAKNLPVVHIGDSSKLRVGQWVVAIGAPFGFDNSVTQGIVSAIGRALPDENYTPFIQTDVPINPGNSGGPLFNLKGEVVGINSQIYSRTGGYMGLSFAIPINVAMNIADQLKAHGKVSRGRLGVEIQELTPDLAKSFGLPNANGVLVAGVDKSGPAGKAGVRPGDVILKYNGKPVSSSSELPLLVAATKPGTTVRLDVWRKGGEKHLDVVVGELSAKKVAEASRGSSTENPNRLGLVLSDLTDAQRQQLGVSRGVLVEAAKGAAAQAGIQRGDVIQAVNNTEVNSVAAFNQVVKESDSKTFALLVRRGNAAIYVPVQIGK